MFNCLSETRLNKKHACVRSGSRYAAYVYVILFMISFLSFDNSNAQNVTVSGANAGNGTYATLGAAFTAINGGSQTGANISIVISGNTTETATAQLNSGSWNSFTITPSATSTISGNISGNALVRFDGADNVNIIGFSAGSYLIFSNSSTSSSSALTSTLLFINDASNNKVFACRIFGSSITFGANIIFGTGSSTGNDNNVIDNCFIAPAGTNTPSRAVLFSGSSSFPNNNDTIRSCFIYDFFNSSYVSAGIYIGTGNSEICILNNRFFQTTSRNITSAAQHSVIWIENANNSRIIGNIIGYSAPGATGAYTVTGSNVSSRFLVIYVNAGSTATTSIQGNIITAISFAGIMAGQFTTNPFTIIYVNSGSVNIGNESGNSIGIRYPEDSIHFSTSSSTDSHIFGIYMLQVSDCITSNNSFGNIRISGSGSGAIGMFIMRYSNSPSTWTCQNNVIGGADANSISNKSTAAGSFIVGLITQNSGPGNITGNTIRNMTIAGGVSNGTIYYSLVGIVDQSAGVQTVSQNTIYGLSSTNTTQANVVRGIYFISTAGTHTVEKNFIHSLTASSVSATVTGINAGYAGGVCNYRNNMIRLGITSAGTGLNTGVNIYGINDSNGVNNYYYNSVYIGGNPTTSGDSTFALRSLSTLTPRNYVNNIFFNARSNSGSTGKHYAIRLATTSGCTSKNNDLLVSGTGGVLGFYGSDRADLTAWKSATLLDTNSISANPNFINPSGNSSNVNLHIDTSAASPVNGAGIPIAGITTDFDGNLRNASTPDIGADEFSMKIKLSLTMLIEGSYNPSSNLQVSDTIKVCLRNSNSPYGVVDSATAVVSDSGKAALTFPNASTGNYYLQIKNRNALETWSANPVSMSEGGTTLYDFTTAASQAFGNNMKLADTSPNRYAFFSGDVNKDENIDLADIVDIFNDASAFVTGYVVTDLDGNEIVDLSDLTIAFNNSIAFVSVIRP